MYLVFSVLGIGGRLDWVETPQFLQKPWVIAAASTKAPDAANRLLLKRPLLTIFNIVMAFLMQAPLIRGMVTVQTRHWASRGIQQGS